MLLYVIPVHRLCSCIGCVKSLNTYENNKKSTLAGSVLAGLYVYGKVMLQFTKILKTIVALLDYVVPNTWLIYVKTDFLISR